MAILTFLLEPDNSQPQTDRNRTAGDASQGLSGGTSMRLLGAGYFHLEIHHNHLL